MYFQEGKGALKDDTVSKCWLHKHEDLSLVPWCPAPAYSKMQQPRLVISATESESRDQKMWSLPASCLILLLFCFYCSFCF